MLVQRLTRFEDSESFGTRWNELAGEIPFRRREWLQNWWQAFASRGDLYLLTVRNDEGKVVGIAPWFLDKTALMGRTIRFLGSGEACSDYLSVLTASHCREQVNEALADWLVGCSSSGTENDWDRIHFDAIDTTDASLQLLLGALQSRGCDEHRQSQLSCWRIGFGTSWELYLQSLPKSHRRHMRHAHKRLFESREFEVRQSDSADSWNMLWEKFVYLHQKRRNSLGQAGCFLNPEFHAFLENACEQMLRTNNARLIVIEKDQDPVSSLLLFSVGSVAYAYQMGVNPDYMSDSPGWLVIAAAIQTGLDRGEVALDLLRGDEPYKARMGARPIELQEVRIIPPQLGAKLRHTAWLTGTTFKKWIKTGIEAAKCSIGTQQLGCFT